MVTSKNFQIVGSNGAIESKSATEEQDLEEKVSPYSRQHSMRKSKVSGELERDVALPIVQSSVKLPIATPLNPVTPLRWKSTKRIEFEKKKLQEEIKTKEVVKEEKKNMKLTNEEMKDQSKVVAMSIGVNGIETLDKVDTPTSNHFASQEDKMFTPSTSTREFVGMISIDEKVEDWKHSHPITNGGSNEHAKHCEEVSSFIANHGSDQIDNNSGTGRKPLIGDESATITIDFLRARLLAERASSKAAKEHIQQLTKKVQELEDKLNQEIQSCQKAKEAEQEALMKVESLHECKVSSPSMNEALSQHEKTKGDLHVQELDQANGKCQVLANVEDTRSNATMNIEPNLTSATSLEVNELMVSEVEAIPTSKQEIGDDQCVQSSNKNGSPNIKYDGIPIVPSITSTNGDTSSPTNLELNRQEIRLCIEERFQHMWNQMVVETSALIEDSTIEDCVREGLLKWIHQFPSVVQNILPKPFEEKKLVLETKTKSVQQKPEDVPLDNVDLDQALISKKEIVEDCSLDGASYGDGSETYNKGLKTVASLIERFEANKSIQWECEQGNAVQSLISKQCSSEGSLSQANSNYGTPLSMKPQQMHQQEVVVDEPPKHLLQVEDPHCCSLATNSSISLHEGMTIEGLLITKNNGGVDTYTPGDNTPSTYPNSPIVGDKARQLGGDKIIPIITHGTLDPNFEQTKFGLQGAMDASFITPLLPSPSFGPRIREKRGDISIISEDKLQLLKQSNHERAFDGDCLTPESHSERSSGEIGESTRSQAFIGWINEEEVRRSPALIDTRDHGSLQWDASTRGHHLQHERLAPYSQAGNSNAYIRPDHYPVRNDEREIYRGRMESVSRSMEGLGSSWRSSSDGEGDEMFVDIPDTSTPSTSRRFGPQMSYQANGGSRWSNYYQPENMEGTSQGYVYPCQESPRESFRSRSTSGRMESTSSKVNEVLKALQLAKLSIRNSKTGRPTNSSEPSYAKGDKHNVRMDYGFSDGQITNETPNALRVWSHPEISRRYSTGTFRGAGSTTFHLHSSNSMPFGMLLDAHRKYPEDKFLIG